MPCLQMSDAELAIYLALHPDCYVAYSAATEELCNAGCPGTPPDPTDPPCTYCGDSMPEEFYYLTSTDGTGVFASASGFPVIGYSGTLYSAILGIDPDVQVGVRACMWIGSMKNLFLLNLWVVNAGHAVLDIFWQGGHGRWEFTNFDCCEATNTSSPIQIIVPFPNGDSPPSTVVVTTGVCP